MSYIKKLVYAGNEIIVYKYNSPREGVPTRKGGSQHPTSLKQKQINLKMSNRNILWLICSNFGIGDYFITFTYDPITSPDNYIDAANQLRRVITNTRNYLTKHNIPFYYVFCTESGAKRGGIHHHIVVKNNFDINEFLKRWKYGEVHVKTISTTSVYDLAAYMTKENIVALDTELLDKGLQRICVHSRNLKKPTIKKSKISERDFYDFPQSENGYYILKNPHTMVQGESGYLYQEFVQTKVVTANPYDNAIS